MGAPPAAVGSAKAVPVPIGDPLTGTESDRL